MPPVNGAASAPGDAPAKGVSACRRVQPHSQCGPAKCRAGQPHFQAYADRGTKHIDPGLHHRDEPGGPLRRSEGRNRRERHATDPVAPPTLAVPPGPSCSPATRGSLAPTEPSGDDHPGTIAPAESGRSDTQTGTLAPAEPSGGVHPGTIAPAEPGEERYSDGNTCPCGVREERHPDGDTRPCGAKRSQAESTTRGR